MVFGLNRKLPGSTHDIGVGKIMTDSTAAKMLRDRLPGMWLGVEERKKEVENVVKTVKDLKAEGYEVGEMTLSTAMSRCGSLGTREGLSEVQALFRLSQRFNVEPSRYTTTPLLNAAGKVSPEHYVEALKLIGDNNLDKKDISHYNIQLKVLFKYRQDNLSKSWEAAMEIWKKLELHRIEPSILTFNLLMKLAPDSSTIEWVLKEVRSAGLYEDRELIGTAIRNAAHAKDYSTAKDLFRRAFMDNHLYPDTYIWNGMLLAAGKCGKHDVLLEAFTEMKTRKLVDVVSCFLLVSQCNPKQFKQVAGLLATEKLDSRTTRVFELRKRAERNRTLQPPREHKKHKKTGNATKAALDLFKKWNS